jgi:hypothetical protein
VSSNLIIRVARDKREDIMADVVGAVKKAIEKFCVVCGLGSHRTDWQDETKPPACDGHSKEEVAAAVKAAQEKDKAEAEAAKKAAASQPPAQTPTAQS